jgi:hypothetical protein
MRVKILGEDNQSEKMKWGSSNGSRSEAERRNHM